MIEKIQSSLFLKILLIFIVGIGLFSWAMRISHKKLIRDAHFPKIQKTAVNLSRYILEYIGTEFDTTRARIITDSLGLKLRYRSKTIDWQSHESILDFEDIKIPLFPPDENFRAGFDGGLFAIFSTDSSEALIAIHDRQDGVQYAVEKIFLINMAIAAAIIFLMFAAVRLLLLPIRILGQGVQTLKEGNIEFKIKSQRKDELGKLIRSFSNMVDRIRDMLEARERLLLDVSHELRSPLTRVKLSLEMMGACPEQIEITADIREMEIMITEILESERLASPHNQLNYGTVKIAVLINELIAEMGNTAPGIQQESIPDIELRGDEKRLRILLSNLLANGLKYSEAGGKPVLIKGIRELDKVRLVIQNFGSLIPEKDLPFIFEPFYRVDKSRTKSTGGYGLGLSLARRIAEAHGGSLRITSDEIAGVQAVLILPV